MSSEPDADQGTFDGATLRFVRHLSHPVPVVWQALTDPDARAEWFFAGRLDPVAGSEVDLRDSERGIRGRVIAAEPPHLLEFSWESLDAPDESIVRFELAEAPEGCTLTFTHTVGPQANPDRLAAGWHSLFDALPRHLDGETAETPSRWAEHLDRYRSRLPR